jgi:hypothetical protein
MRDQEHMWEPYGAAMVVQPVARETGRVQVGRVVSAVDSRQAVNPDGIRTQMEGGIARSLSWTTYEAVQFDTTRITSTDWSSYPILRLYRKASTCTSSTGPAHLSSARGGSSRPDRRGAGQCGCRCQQKTLARTAALAGSDQGRLLAISRRRAR